MSYSTNEAALALGTTPKRLDNMLSRDLGLPVDRGRQGRTRVVNEVLIERLAVALLLQRDLGVPLRRAVDLSGQLVASSSHQVDVGTLASLHFDLPALRLVLQNALADVVQDRVPIKRGRPPAKAKRGASL